MGHAIPKQHPAVVLRSHYNLVRALLGITLVALVAMTIAVVVVASDGDDTVSVSAAQPEAVMPRLAPAPQVDAPRYDGGPEEGTRSPLSSPIAPDTRYDGGPEEGSRGPSTTSPAPDARYDGGPEEGTRGPGFSTD
jgi:hypothetical protein